VPEGNGPVGEYVGGYADWRHQRLGAIATVTSAAARPSLARNGTTATKCTLSFKDQCELQLLHKRIKELETEIASGSHAKTEPDFFRQNAATITVANDAVAKLQAELDSACARCSDLDA
jgi:ATP-binding cassette subfamily F protein uup